MRKLIIERMVNMYNKLTNLSVPTSVYENTLLIFTDEQLLNIYEFMVLFSVNSNEHFLSLLLSMVNKDENK